MDPQSGYKTLPSPQLYDRSLNTSDIRGAQPQKPMVRSDIDNKSLVTSDIKGAQPKVNIRTLNHPHYDPSLRMPSVDNSQFQRAPTQQAQNNTVSNSPPPSSYFVKPPYQGINSADPEKSSFYNGPVADRDHRPNNQPPSQILKEQTLITAPYHQKDSSNIPIRLYSNQNNYQEQQQNEIVPQSSIKPFYKNNIKQRPSSYQIYRSSPQILQPQQAINQQQNTGQQSSNPQYQGQEGADWKRTQMSRSTRPISQDSKVEEFNHTAVLRPTNFDSQDKYLKFKESIRNRVISPKHYDLPEKMMNYQIQKDKIASIQQPKLNLNRGKQERQLLSQSTFMRGTPVSSPNIFLPSKIEYKPTPAQIVLLQQQQQQSSLQPQLQYQVQPQQQQQDYQYQGERKTPLKSPLIQYFQQQQIPTIQGERKTPSQGSLLNRIEKVPQDITLSRNSYSRPKSNDQLKPNSNGQQPNSPLLLGKLSPKHENIERNIFAKPLTSDKKSNLTYIKPYHLNPSVDITTEYITKYNQSSIQQLQKSITPSAQLNTSSKQVPWENKQEEYNLIGNYVQDKRTIEKFDGYNRPVDGYYKKYDSSQLDGMRKDIHENGDVIPYEVKFKYEQTKNNYYPVNSVTKVRETPPSQQQELSKSFAAGYSDIFRTQHYSIRDPVDPRKFIYASKPAKNNSALLS